MKWKLTLLILGALILSLGFVSSAPLVVDGTTVTLGGDLVYDYVYVSPTGIININSTIGYLNITAVYNITIEGLINGTGAGFTGGDGAICGASCIDGGLPGDGTGAGGGGTGDGTGAGGGGGAGHANGGGTGGGTGAGGGGSSYGSQSNITNYTLGSGGGGGGASGSGLTSSRGGNGGNGGAATILISPLINISGSLINSGLNGLNGGTTGSNSAGAGGGGGGSGGSITLIGLEIYNQGILNVSAGNGGNGDSNGVSPRIGHGGGGGSGGRIKIFYLNFYNNLSSTTSLNGGNGGSGAGLNAQNGFSGGVGIQSASQEDVTPYLQSNLVILDEPENGVNTLDTNQTFEATLFPQQSGFENVNATLFIWNDGALVEQETNSVTGSSQNTTSWDITNLSFGQYEWNVLGCFTNISINECKFSSINNTFVVGFVENSINYNSSTYETASETFILNLSVIEVDSILATFYYDGVNKGTSVQTISGDNTIFTKTIDIPVGNGANDFYWTLMTGGESVNTTINSQNVSEINLTLCEASPQNVSYANFTFRDESTNDLISAMADAVSWTYWLGSGEVNKTYDYSNSTSNPSYAFCFSPSDREITTDLIFRYSNTTYPLRTFSWEDMELSNQTTDQTLYLLGVDDGIFSSIQVVNQLGSPISGALVTIERQIGGEFVIVGQETTGEDGIVTFWVNPNFPHRITSVKVGFTTAQVTIIPSQSQYSLTMTAIGASDALFNGSTEGMSWQISPSSGYLAPGEYTFSFDLIANLNNLAGSLCRLDLVDRETLAVVATTNGTGNASQCSADVLYEITEGQSLFGKLYVWTEESGGFFLIDTDQRWTDIEGTDVSTWQTIRNFFTELTTIDEWGEGDHRQEWNRIVGFFLILSIIIGISTFKTQWDSSYPGVAILIVTIIIIFASTGGWFTLNAGGSRFNFIDKYAVAITAIMISLAWVTSWMRRTSVA